MYAPPTDPALWQTWRTAARNPTLRADLAAVHQRIADAVETRKPRCDQSGRCCRFDAFGHDLYLTGLEITAFLQDLQHQHAPQAGPKRSAGPGIKPPSASPKQSTSNLPLPQLQTTQRTCPHQTHNTCSVHPIRPAGCRIFFCEPGTQAWQQDLYEQSLNDIRQIHTQHHLPYHYMEWLAGLAAAEAR
ncbi:MAG: hypothetical protein AAF823_11105 [Planctomycetota bacterium]